MFILINEVFIVLLSFIKSLVAKCVSLNDEPCMVSPFLIDLNPVELKYYLFIVICYLQKYMFQKKKKRRKCKSI